MSLVLHESATRSLASMVLPVAGDLLLIVGPEGGLAPDELDAFDAAGATAVRLGPQVLRTSTAARGRARRPGSPDRPVGLTSTGRVTSWVPSGLDRGPTSAGAG